MFILGHAWLNLWDKHMTTGRINQVTILFGTLLPLAESKNIAMDFEVFSLESPLMDSPSLFRRLVSYTLHGSRINPLAWSIHQPSIHINTTTLTFPFGTHTKSPERNLTSPPIGEGWLELPNRNSTRPILPSIVFGLIFTLRYQSTPYHPVATVTMTVPSLTCQ
jgi:hypothetical protein